MHINSVIKHVDLSKRAIKFYEEKGLLKVERDNNGYRNYSKENIVVLQKISIYRKLGVDVNSIKKILTDKQQEKEILQQVYAVKVKEINRQKEQLSMLEDILTKDIDYALLDMRIEYRNIADAMMEMIPGMLGKIWMHYFLPYLDIPIETVEQKEAYHNIIQFWDTVDIRVPLSMRITKYFNSLVMKASLKKMKKGIDDNIKKMLHPTPEEYCELKRIIYHRYKQQNRFFHKYLLFSRSKRKMMKELQRCGYYDIFLPNLEKLSPKYHEYRSALYTINDRICRDLGLRYDADFNLVIDK